MDNGEFLKSMMEFKGSVESSLDNLCKDIKEMKREREQHSEKFWTKIDSIITSIQQEKIERQQANGLLNTELQIIKAKAGTIATIVSIIVTSVIAFLLRLIKWNNN